MTFAIAAAGTAGHVYPALAVAEALVSQGVARSEVLFIGGDRLEAEAVPRAGFSILSVPLQGLARRITVANLTIPIKVSRAVRRIRRELAERGVGVMLATGGYVAAPAGWAARAEGIPFFLSEQNAAAGLANRVMERWAARSFASFPHTSGLKKAEWVGNPVRADLARLDRDSLRKEACRRYDLANGLPVVGVMGGSLGAAAINRGVCEMLEGWNSEPVQVVHLTGARSFGGHDPTGRRQCSSMAGGGIRRADGSVLFGMRSGGGPRRRWGGRTHRRRIALRADTGGIRLGQPPGGQRRGSGRG